MSKSAAIFVAAAMGVTAACIAVIASFGLGLGLPESTLVGVAALLLMAIAHLAFLRAGPREDARVEEIDRFVNELESRLETIEVRLSTIEGAAGERARAATKPLVAEIAALGGLVTQIAKEVAGHDVAIGKLNSAARPVLEEPLAAAEPAPPEPAPEEPFRETASEPSPASSRETPEAFDPAENFQPPPPAGNDLALRVARALAENRIEPYLQPIVTLPSRRVAHYEALARLTEADGVIPAGAFLAAAGASLAAIDRRLAERCAPIAQRVAAKGGGAVFLNLAPATLRSESARAAIAALLRDELANAIVIELGQSAFRFLGPEERKALEAFVALGARLSLDNAVDLRLEPGDLAARGVRFVKTPAARLLDPEAAKGAAIHPTDLSGLLARHGIDLVATHVEDERTVPELLDMEVRFGQGELFGAPRPVRPASEAVPTAPPAAPARLVPRQVAAR